MKFVVVFVVFIFGCNLAKWDIVSLPKIATTTYGAKMLISV